MSERVLALRAWSDDSPAGLVDDDLARGPVALCVSGGGFRSYACVLGQIRALLDRDVMANVGLISGVSGGAWAGTAYAYAPGESRDRLGPALEPEDTSLSALAESIDDAHLAHPIAEMDAMAHARTLRDEGISTARIFSRVLGDQLLGPLGIETGRVILAGGDDQMVDIFRRNPDLDPGDILTPVPGRAPVVTGASMMFRGADRFEYVPIELTSGTLCTLLPVEGWPVRAVELPAVTGAPRSLIGDGVIDVDYAESFGLPDLMAATGGAPGGVLVEIASLLGLHADDLVLRAAHWLGLDPAPFLVDGGYVENTGLLSALRRGADRVMVMVNSNVGLGSRLSPFSVQGLEGQIARLFGQSVRFGAYAGQPLRLFEEDGLVALADALTASKARGELPWALMDHRLTEDNLLGLPPKTVRVYWQLNEVPSAWASRLPDDTLKSLNQPFGELRRVPHLAVAFAYGGYLFRLRKEQLGAMVALHDHALRSRSDDVWEALVGGPEVPLPASPATD